VGSLRQVATVKDEARRRLIALLTTTETTGHFFKIGISSNPTGRSYGHNKVAVDEREVGDLTYVTLQSGFWSHMYVIYQNPRKEVVRGAEREFIELTWKTFGNPSLHKSPDPRVQADLDQKFLEHNLISMNDNPGGEGPLGRLGPHYLYVLRSLR
jgi:hypothetical protein